MNDTTKKRGRGRPPIFGKPMTRREIWRRHYEKCKASGKSRSQVLAALRNENSRLREVADIGRQLVVWYVRPIGGRVIGSMSPSGLCDPSEIARLWERLHALVHGGDR